MARIESISVGGYYPTPSRVLPLIASLFQVEPEGHYNYLDPCAGDGDAILSLLRLLHGEEKKGLENVELCTVEMELTRYAALKEACKNNVSWHCSQSALHGDAFCVRFKVSEGVSLLYLNPPYDTDPVCGRLEEKFLVRYTATLMKGGLLVFLVPFYALTASAKTLAKEYTNIDCLRFPEPEFEGYKQVVLIATKREASLFEPDPKIEAQVQKWAKDASAIPVLKEGARSFKVPQAGKWGKPFDTWKIMGVDFAGLIERTKPWSVTDRAGKTQPIVGIVPEGTVEDLLIRRYPVAMPPRSAHIAAGIAAGIFNGSRINPDNPDSKLPPILVKGVFDKEFRTVEEKEDKEGNVKALVQVQQPKLVTTVLDLRTSTYHTIRASADQTGSQDLATMTMADLLAEYGRGLMTVMLQQCPVLHDPARIEHHIPLANVARPLFKAQSHATQAAVKLLGGPDASKGSRRFKSAFVLGEIGSGKCLGLGTPVLRFDGTVVPVEEIRTGDLLMGPDSTPRRVLGTTRGVGPLFKVRPTVGAPWVCNDAHILTLVHTQSDDVLDIPLQELLGSERIQRPLSKAYIWRKKGKTSRRTTHPVSEFKQFFPALGVDFPQAPAPSIDPYFLGIWYGDGTKDLGSVSVTTADREVVEVLKEVAEKHGLSVRSTLSPKRCPTYTLTQGRVGGRPNPLLNQLREVVGNGARLPQNYLTGSRETRRAFLAGLLDSDGHYSRGGVFDFIQKNKCWAEDVCFLARSLGIRATISTARKSAYRGEKGDVYWRVCLSGELSDVPTRLRRKQARPRAQTRRNVKLDTSSGTRRMPQVNRTSIKIEAVGEGPYAGFELDGDGRFLLGDFTVTHNTSVALATAETIKSKRTLVMCPPHLLQSWIDQAKAVVPWVRTVVLEDILDMQKLAASKDEGPVLAILSREAGKLGHGYASVAGICPGCGEELADRDFAKKREVCDAKRLRPRDVVGRTAINLALSLVKVFPHDHRLSQILRTRPLRALVERLRKGDEDTKPGFDYAGWKAAEAAFDAVIDVLLQDEREGAWHAILALLMAAPKAARVLRVARAAFAKNDVRRAKMALLLTGDSPEVAALVAEMKASEGNRYYSPSWDPWKNWTNKRAYLHTGEGESAYDHDTEDFKREKGAKTFTWKGCEYGNPKSAAEAVGFLSTTVFFGWSKECGTPLFQAVPEPRRFPIATFIARRHPNFFDLLILDECHEYATDGAAQERSAHRLTSLGLPTLALTGTIMNGYAESMFTNMWALSKDFRQEFDRDERARFVDRYGYRKRLVEDRDKKTGEIVEYGSMSDRVERMERTIGHAPGVLPLFLLKYLLPQAVTLHKTDLLVDIPACTEQTQSIVPEEELLKRYRGLERALLDQIRKDRFEKDLAGKLWGAMADLPSYLDLATEDTGNRDGGCYSIRYPESVGGDLVAAAEPFPLTMILPKEAWLLDQVQEAIDSDRNVMVFAWHTALLPRLSRLLEKRLKTKCPILDPGKVPTKKRQAWIDEQVVAKGRRVLVVNPVAIQTGLNNLVYFSDQIWMENPMCNPTIYRQAVGRVDRIGQEELTRIFFPLYSGTSQVALHSLLMQKVAVSMSTDGLDAESALRAAGIGEDSGFSSFAVGRQLYEMILSGRMPEAPKAPKKRLPAPKPKVRAFTEEDIFNYAMQLE